jgi:hypothetical protein
VAQQIGARSFSGPARRLRCFGPGHHLDGICLYWSSIIRQKLTQPRLCRGRLTENAVAMAIHTSTRTMQLYDRRPEEVSLDEVERISI